MSQLLTLYPFRYFDLMRRKWYSGRYVATIEEIAARHAAFRIVGAPEIREISEANKLSAGHLVGSRDR